MGRGIEGEGLKLLSPIAESLTGPYLLGVGDGDFDGLGEGVGVGLVATPLARALLVVLRPGVRIGPGPWLAK